MNKFYLFHHNSPKCQAFFEIILDKIFPSVSKYKLKGLSQTLCVECHEAYERFLDMLPALVMAADIITHPHL